LKVPGVRKGKNQRAYHTGICGMTIGLDNALKKELVEDRVNVQCYYY
jgi:hypothetical protein